MLFTSLEFVLFFLPVVVIINLLLPRKLQNLWLCAASIFFYAWGEPKFVFAMLASIIINYLFALILDVNRSRTALSRLILWTDILINLGILFTFKYMNFTTSILHGINENIAVTNYILPIGISFYTFQALSYVIDVYRGEKAQKNILYTGLYISFFPQLIAGPIVRYSEIKDQIDNRKMSFEKFSDGILRFLIGFNKKMLVANILANAADASFAAGENTVLMAWIGALCYTLQIYFDFSGYSDMAIGLAKLFGFDFHENFNYPYISGTVSEFWRRWHISLGHWFRDYVYFPLGGSRVSGKKRIVFNLMVVWLLTGIWHGANTTFILWGIAYGVLISVEKTFEIPARLKNHRNISVLYRIFTMFAVIMGWVMFRSDDLHSAFGYMADMFGLRAGGLWSASDVFYLKEYGFFMIAGCILSFPVIKWMKEKLYSIKRMNEIGKSIIDSIFFLANIALFLVGISYLVISAHNPFIYFNF